MTTTNNNTSADNDISEDLDTSTRDFLPPDLAEYLQQAEDAMLAATTDITSPSPANTTAQSRGNSHGHGHIPNTCESMTMIRESYESEDVGSSSCCRAEFPVTVEEEESVLRKILGGGSGSHHQEEEEERNLEAEFGAEQDSSLNLDDMSILNGDDSDVMQEGLNTVDGTVESNGIDGDGDGAAKVIISPIQKFRRRMDSNHQAEKVIDERNIPEKMTHSSKIPSSPGLLSPEEKKARAALVTARKKRIDGQLEKIKMRRESTSRQNKDNKSSSKQSDLSPSPSVKAPSIRSSSRLLQSARKPPSPNVNSVNNKFNEEEEYLQDHRSFSRINSSSRLLQSTGAAESVAAPISSVSSNSRRLSVSRISSSSRLLQPKQSPASSVMSNTSMRQRLEPDIQRLSSRFGSSTLSSRLLRPTKASNEHRESARRELSSKIPGYAPPGTPVSTLTVPEAPKLSTSFRLGEKSYGISGRRRESLDPNPITRVYGSPTHAATLPPRPPSAGMSCATPRQLTVPKTPNFSTNKRHGKHRYSVGGGASVCSGMFDGEVSPTLAEKVNNFDKSILRSGKVTSAPEKSDMKVTIPKPPKFLSRYRRDEVQRLSSPTFAEVMESYSKSVRKPEIVSKFEPKLTVPKSPNFSAKSHRALPKSSAELEEEMMTQVKKNPFKARPVTSLIARPVISTNTNVQTRGLTKLEPFRLSTIGRQSSVNDLPPPPSKDDVELARRFKARPVPNLRDNRILRPTHKSKLTIPKAPRLSVSNRKVRDDDAKENLIARMKERVKQRTKAGSEAKPFRLLSEQRHEVYQQNLSEKMKNREEEEVNARKFKARLFTNRPPTSIPKPSGKLTSPQPFKLECVQRHESYQQTMNEKLKLEEEQQRKQSHIKANPVPASHQTPYTPSLPSKNRRKLDFLSPSLSVEKRLQQRHEFDRTIREKEHERVEAQVTEKEIKLQEEKWEIQRLRKLPVSEGGMQFTARPVRRSSAVERSSHTETVTEPVA